MIDRIIPRLASFAAHVYRWPSILWAFEARLRGIEMGGRVEFLGRPIFARFPGSTMRLGERGIYASSLRCNPLGNAQPCVLRTVAPNARLEIGAGVGMSSTVVCAATSISIGEGTICGAGAMIIDTDFHEPIGEFGWSSDCAAVSSPVRIGRGCFLGARSVILKGVTIGDRAIVGAAAVVTHDVPAGALAVGNPARILPRRQGHQQMPDDRPPVVTNCI